MLRIICCSGPAICDMAAICSAGSPAIPGRPPASGPPSPVSIDPSESTTLPATGSTSSRQAGRVASTHSARLQAWVVMPGGPKSVTWSSQSPATWAASVTCDAVAAETEGSPSVATALRAASVAMATLNGSSAGAENMACTWAVIICSMAGSTLSMPMP